MKCEFCGYNIDIKSDVCPFCGMKKSQFEEHRRAMKQYDSDFRTTQETVVRKNQKFSSDAARITIICALIIGILILFICTIQNHSIYRSIYTHKLNLAPEKHYAQLKAYEEAGDYEAFDNYYNTNNLHYAERENILYEYRAVSEFTSAYSRTVSALSNYIQATEAADTQEQQRYLEYFLSSYSSFQTYYDLYDIANTSDVTGDSYDKDTLSPKHIASVEDMRYKLNRLIISYLGIDESQIETFQNETTAHQTIMIEEALNNEQ